MLSQRRALFLQMPILIQMCSRLEVANRKIARKQTKPNIPNGVVHLGRWEAVQEHTRKSSKHAGYAMPALWRALNVKEGKRWLKKIMRKTRWVKKKRSSSRPKKKSSSRPTCAYHVKSLPNMGSCGSIKKASGSSSPATDNIFWLRHVAVWFWARWKWLAMLFRQQRIEDGIHKTRPGDGFMWLQDGPTWKQVAWWVPYKKQSPREGAGKTWQAEGSYS